MGPKLFVWVEGATDARFFETVLKPLLEKKYNRVEVRTYATIKKGKVVNLLSGIRAANNDYILVADIDEEPSVTAKKALLKERFRSIDERRIQVVIREIESWYLAGIDEDGAAWLGLPNLETTDTITKEDFETLIPEKFDSRIDFMMEMLKAYSTEVARRKNRSFSYFIYRHHLETAIP